MTVISAKPTSEHFQQWFRVAVFSLLILVTGAGLTFRFYHLQADPPYWGLIYNTDEAHYSYTAHNKLLFGHWFVNDAKYGLMTPLFAFTQYLVALIAQSDPSSVVTYRLVSAISGIVSCLLMTLFFKERWQQLTAVAIASISFMLFVHSRMGITEMLLTLMLQIAVLAAAQSFLRNNILLATISGVAAIGAIMVKPTAMFISPIFIIAPLLCRATIRTHRSYWLGLGSGIAVAFALWISIVIAPNWEAWRYFTMHGSAAGREGMSFGFSTVENLWNFILSPGLITLPFLWPLALCFCFASWLPQWWRKENTFLDTLVVLWILTGIGILGITDFQPVRWQILLFPPVIYAGLKFLQEMQKPVMVAVGLITVVALSLIYSIHVPGQILASGEINPGAGILGYSTVTLTIGIVFCAGYFFSRFAGCIRWQQLARGIIAAEIAMQCWFHAKLTVPSFNRPSLWEAAAKDLKTLPSADTAIFSGELTQDFSLRAKIHTLPTYYLLDDVTDASLRDFFTRQSSKPDYFIVIDASASNLTVHAPAFANSLEVVRRYPLIIGGIGFHNVFVCHFKSYDWLDDGKN